MNGCLLAVCLATLSAGPVDTLVVCPEPLRPALTPWLAHRAAQGHRIALLAWRIIGGSTARRDPPAGGAGGLEYVVLVGDCASGQPTAAGALTVPTFQIPAKVTPRFGSEPTIASDNGYADLDGDAIPELAVGRLTADTPDELAGLSAKILAYERSTDFGPWRRNVNLLAGVGGFGVLVDSTIESAARRIIVGGVPPAYTTRITYGNWRSPYCPNPRDFHQAALDSLSEGSLCWIYVGHASPYRLADSGSRRPSAMPRSRRPTSLELRSLHGAPIACLLACYTGAFDCSGDCLAEEMLRAPGGPVAVVGGSRVTMPYAMACLVAN